LTLSLPYWKYQNHAFLPKPWKSKACVELFLVVDGLRWNILNFNRVFCHVIFPKEKGDHVGLISERASLGRLLLFRHASTTVELGS
jgi:hypothetical protein